MPTRLSCSGGKARDELDEVIPQRRKSPEYFLGPHGHPLWPLRVILGCVPGKLWPLLAEDAPDPLESDFVHTSEVREILVGRPLA